MGMLNPIVARTWSQLDNAIATLDKEDRPTLRRMVSEYLEGRIELLISYRGPSLEVTRVISSDRYDTFEFEFDRPSNPKHFCSAFVDLCELVGRPSPERAAA